MKIVIAPDSQKGATKSDITLLDNGLANFARCIKQQFSIDIINKAGAGVAGGMAVALLAFTNAQLKPGIEIVLSAVNLQ